MPKQTSFVEIVEQMVEEGHDLASIVETLKTLGLSRAEAEKLVEIMEKRSVPKAQQAIDQLVRKKIISVEAAKQLRLERHALSSRRRQETRLEQAFKNGDSLIREFFPGKHLAFKQRWKKMLAARQQERETRKELQALLLELESSNLPYRAGHKLDKAIKLLE